MADMMASQPHPATTYAEAAARFEELSARDNDKVNSLCRSQLLTHGEKVERAIVLVHGIPTARSSTPNWGRSSTSAASTS